MGLTELFANRNKKIKTSLLTTLSKRVPDKIDETKPLGAFMAAIRRNNTVGMPVYTLYDHETVINMIRSAIEEGRKDNFCAVCNQISNPAYRFTQLDGRIPKVIEKVTFCRRHKDMVAKMFKILKQS